MSGRSVAHVAPPERAAFLEEENARLKEALRRIRRLMAGGDHAPGETPATCVVCMATKALGEAPHAWTQR